MNSSLNTIIDKEILLSKSSFICQQVIRFIYMFVQGFAPQQPPNIVGASSHGDTLIIIQALELTHSIFRTQCLLVQVTHRESKYANSTLDILRLTTCLVRRYYKVPNSALTSSVDFFSVYRRMKIVQKEWYQDKWYVVIGPEQCASQ